MEKKEEKVKKDFSIDEYKKIENIYEKYLYCISKVRNNEKCKEIMYKHH